MDPGRLKNLPLFEGVSEEELSHIAPFVDETSVSEGARLVNEGDYSYQFMAIEEGTAEVVKGGEKLADLGPGDFFGEMGLMEKDRRSASVVATSRPAGDHHVGLGPQAGREGRARGGAAHPRHARRAPRVRRRQISP